MLEILNSYKFRITSFVGMYVICALIFYNGTQQKKYDDPLPEISVISQEKKLEFGSFSAKVLVGVLIKSFVNFDVVKNNFVADMTLWFEYNSDQLMLDTVSQFSFDNGEILRRSPPDVKFKGDRVTAEYDLRVSFRSNLVYKKFPLENHRISIILSNNFVTPSELYFEAEDAGFKIEPTIFIPDWSIEGLSTDVGFSETVLDQASNKVSSTPKARFTINLNKKGIKETFIIFVPLYIATSIAIYSFSSSLMNATIRNIMASSSVPALLGYRFVLQNILPSVSYFTLADFIYLMLLSLSFAIFITQSVFIRKMGLFMVIEKDPKKIVAYRDYLGRFDDILYYLSILITVLGTYFFVFY